MRPPPLIITSIAVLALPALLYAFGSPRATPPKLLHLQSNSSPSSISTCLSSPSGRALLGELTPMPPRVPLFKRPTSDRLFLLNDRSQITVYRAEKRTFLDFFAANRPS